MQRLLFICLFVLSVSYANAQSATPAFIGSFHQWKAFTFSTDQETGCYMIARPILTAEEEDDDHDMSMIVAHRPTEKTFNTITIMMGDVLADQSEVLLTVGSKEFKLFSDHDKAWAKDQALDDEIVAAMKASTKMTVQGTTKAGEIMTDTFSLKGFQAAHTKISQACPLK